MPWLGILENEMTILVISRMSFTLSDLPVSVARGPETGCV